MPDPTTAVETITTSPPAADRPPLWRMAAVMSAGVFATTFVQLQALGSLPFNHLLDKMGLNSADAANFMFWGTLPWSLKFIAGLFIDGVPLFGSRRRIYLILSAFVATIAWTGIAFAPHQYRPIFLLVILANCAAVFGSTASGGLLVEAGQLYGATGRLSSLRVFAQNFGAQIGLWIGGMIAAYSLGWTAAAAILSMSTLLFSAWFLLREKRVASPFDPSSNLARRSCQIGVSIFKQIKNVWRPHMIVPAMLVFFIQAVPTFRSTCLYQFQVGPLHYTDAQLGWIGFVSYGIALLACGVYAWWCTRVPLRLSLYIGVLVAGLSALPYLNYPAYHPYMIRVLCVESVGTFLQYLAYLPLFDLVVRSCPKGSEALGYSVLIGIWNLGLGLGAKWGPSLYEYVLHKNMNSLVWLNASVTLAGIILVVLLPKALVSQSEGKSVTTSS